MPNRDAIVRTDRQDDLVTELRWDEVRYWFDVEWNGSAPDGVIHGTTVDDWNAIVRLAYERAWRIEYRDEDEVRPVPADLCVAFGEGREFQPMLAVWPKAEILIDFWLHAPDTIDFDFSLHDVQDQAGLDWLCGFLRVLGQEIGKAVEVMPEGFDQAPFLRYDPTIDRVNVVQP